MVYYCLIVAFVLGAAVGSFLNVCIHRLPLQKSILWPGSRCGHCLQPIHWYDNIPLLSYWILRGRCRACGTYFSVRYFLVELLTALGFAGLFHLEVVQNVHDFPVLRGGFNAPPGILPFPWQGLVIWGSHALLLSLLIATSFCDLEHREIPLTITIPGAILGLMVAMFWAWPWPYTPAEALPGIRPGLPWWNLNPKIGLFPWPVSVPLPEWLPLGSWQLGLVNGLAGMLAGTLALRGIRFLFGMGAGKEGLGLGDADIMMMAGAFLGWQPILIAFLVAVLPALFLGIVQLILYRDNALPFGPSLAVGLVATWLAWDQIGPSVRYLFFNSTLILILVVSGAVLLLIASFVVRLLALMRGKEV